MSLGIYTGEACASVQADLSQSVRIHAEQSQYVTVMTISTRIGMTVMKVLRTNRKSTFVRLMAAIVLTDVSWKCRLWRTIALPMR